MPRRRLLVVVLVVAVIAAVSLLFPPDEVANSAQSAPPDIRPGGAAPAAAAPPADVPAEVNHFLRNDQFWRAARRMREYLRQNPAAPPEAVLVAARAEAGWGGWDRIRDYLEGRAWLDEAGGEGWYWLARALEQDREWEPAVTAYGRFLRAGGAADPDQQTVARFRQGLLLLRLGRAEQGADALEAMRDAAPDVAPWINLLAAEALAERGDTARIRRLTAELPAGDPWYRGQLAQIEALREAGDPHRARAQAHAARAAADSDSRRARFSLVAAHAALALRDDAAARADLRSSITVAPSSSAAREAALLFGELKGVSTADRLAIARVYDRQGNNARAATGYRAWLEAGEGSASDRRDVRLRLGRALFDAGRYAEAEAALRPLTEGAPPEIASQALHLIGRAEYRRGNRAQAQRTFLRLAERYPGSDAGSEALFLVADLSHDARETTRARGLYRRVASEFRGTDRAGLSLMRLGGMAFLDRDYEAAARAWDEYRSSYPRGERWLESTYWAGRAREAMGDVQTARARYRAVREREPLSYYAVRSAQRLGEPYWPLPMAASPADEPAARRRVEGWMHGVDLLRSAGLFDEAEEEADRWATRAGDDPALLYPLAEALIDRGFTVRGIRLGLKLQRQGEPQSERLLRILYPFPYRSMIQAEAREKRLDPFLVAALIRQESMFKARIASPVGARGLMQIMPETGRALARPVGIQNWDPELLYQPEINAHLGTTYLADQMRTYNGSLPSVFSAYNAGPHRVERWKAFPEYGNEELFTERIPYRETRDYVKILTRNIEIYRGLYGADDTAGGASGAAEQP